MKTYYVQTYTLYEVAAQNLEEAKLKVKHFEGNPIHKPEVILGQVFWDAHAFMESIIVLDNSTAAINKPE